MADAISDLLESQKGRRLTIKLRTGKIVTGVLRDFDVHMSMKLDSAREVPTDSAKDGRTAEKGGGEEEGKEAVASDTTSAITTTERDLGSVLLRGDNILMISIPDDDDDGNSNNDDRDSGDAGSESSDASATGSTAG